jgi:hypothetical protein
MGFKREILKEAKSWLGRTEDSSTKLIDNMCVAYIRTGYQQNEVTCPAILIGLQIRDLVSRCFEKWPNTGSN